MQKRMGELLARVTAIEKTCSTCGYQSGGYCAEFCEDLPPDFKGPCDKWEWRDIPF